MRRKAVTIKLAPDLERELSDLAQAENRTLSNKIEKTLRDAVRADAAPKSADAA